MSNTENSNGKIGTAQSDLTIGKAISELTLGQASAVIGAAVTIAASIFYLGGEFSPSARDLKRDNGRLMATLAKVAISDGKTRPFVIEDFIVSQKVRMAISPRTTGNCSRESSLVNGFPCPSPIKVIRRLAMI